MKCSSIISSTGKRGLEKYEPLSINPKPAITDLSSEKSLSPDSRVKLENI